MDDAHEPFMRIALERAARAGATGEVPIGAVIVQGGRVVGSGFNQPIARVDPTAHAEILALREAAHALGNYRLPGSTLYVTVEPCLMCVGAALNARVGTVVFGPAEPKFGAVVSLLRIEDLATTHRLEVVAGILEAECRELMVEFFRAKRG
jgi:tRNA(adenine34) deaminase